MAVHQAPPSLGFSRQEHWSGLPFPSPMHESEKWKWRRSVLSDSSQPCGLQPTRLLCPWDFPGKSTGVGCHCLLQPYLLEHYVSCCPSCQLTWCCQNPYDPSSCTTSAPGPHRGKPKSSRAASGANPSGRPRGSVTKEEDLKPSHQLYKLQIKSRRSTRQTPCLRNM